MAQFLTFLDQNSQFCYVALDDISCVIAYDHTVDDIACSTAIYTKSDPDAHLSALYTPDMVMSGTVVNIGKLL